MDTCTYIRVLVTGSNGLVGKTFIDLLYSKYDARSVTRADSTCTEIEISGGDNRIFRFLFLTRKSVDLSCEGEALKCIFDTFKPHTVVHLAARVGGLYANSANNVSFYLDNARISNNVLECVHQSTTVHKLVNVLSTCVFPDNVEYPLRSEYIHNGPPHGSNSGYSHAKRQCELLSRMIFDAKQAKRPFSVVNLIPTNLFGIHDNWDLDRSHVIPALIRKGLMVKHSKTETLQVIGDGTDLRQFVYAKDFAQIIFDIVTVADSTDMSRDPHSESEYTSVVVCPPAESELAISQVANKIADAFGLTQCVSFSEGPVKGQPKKTSDDYELQALYRKLGKTPFVFSDIDHSLKEVCDYIHVTLNSDTLI